MQIGYINIDIYEDQHKQQVTNIWTEDHRLFTLYNDI